jgi:hypothetical protein
MGIIVGFLLIIVVNISVTCCKHIFWHGNSFSLLNVLLVIVVNT